MAYIDGPAGSGQQDFYNNSLFKTANRLNPNASESES
jgi:hypothetical protein